MFNYRFLQMTLIDSLKWRNATKAYNPIKKIKEADLDKIIEAIQLAPTSSGLQQFRAFVIEDQDTKEQLMSTVLNPECMRDCSHVIVFAAWNEYTDQKIDDMYDFTTDERSLPRGRFNSYTDKLKASFNEMDAKAHFDHAARQTYIALGLALAQAAELKIDSTPAEGFSTAVMDEILDLPAQGLGSTVMLYLGYRDEENDWMSKMKKVRIPKEELVLRWKK